MSNGGAKRFLGLLLAGAVLTLWWLLHPAPVVRRDVLRSVPPGDGIVPNSRSHTPVPVSSNAASFSGGRRQFNAGDSDHSSSCVSALSLAACPSMTLDRDPKFWTPSFIRSTSKFLTLPHPDSPAAEVVKEFVKANARTLGIHHSDIAPPNAYLTRDVFTKHNGMRSLTYQQTLNGLDIYGATFAINMTKNNEVINVSSRALFLEEIRFRKDKRKLTAEEAIEAAVRAVERQRTEKTTEYTDGHGYGEDGLVASKRSEDGGRRTEDGLAQRRKDAEDSDPINHQPSTINHSPLTPSHKLVYFPRDMMSVVLAWDVVVSIPGNPETHHIILDAETGEVFFDQSLTCTLESATYNVFTNDSPTPFSPGQSVPTNHQPPEVSRALVTLTALDTNASPSGWINDGGNATIGNNIDAYADWNDDNSPDGNRPQGSPYRVFNASLDLNQSPSNYLNAAVIQAFYWGNILHDKLYALGFDEASGNFQSNNFGRGGKDGDPVKIEAQDGLSIDDGSHRNNANFTTMSDGYSGRMQLYVWDRSNPDRDSALDAEVVFHEYAHGISGRLIGDGYGLSGTQPRGLGEGWSDFMTLSLLSEAGDDVNGCYAAGAYVAARNDNLNNYYYGVRRFPYTTDTNKAPQTLADTDPAQIGFPSGVPMNPTISEQSADESHRAGEIWCLALWECRANLIGRYGFTGNDKMLRLVIDGMKLTPTTPTFIQARDAILQADMVNNGGTNRLELWKGFARRGLGYSASLPASSTTAGVREGFDLPVSVATMLTEAAGDGDGYVEPGESGRLEIRLTSYEQALHSVTGTLSAVSTNVTVTQGSTMLPDIVIGGTSTSGVPLEFSVDAGFPGFTDAEFLLTVVFSEGSFSERVLARIGNPYSYAPEITGVTVTNIGETNATITWATGIPADSQVKYGTTTNYGFLSSLNPTLVTNHAVQLVGLDRGTTYHFVAASRGTNGLLGVSADQTFTTKARIYVNVNSIATQELGTINAPYKSIQTAANAANAGDELLVAEGTYTGTNVEGVLVLSNATDNLKVYGGYSSDFSMRDWDKYVTVFDGQKARRGIFLGGGSTLVIEGIWVLNGAGEWGGGVHINGSTFSAENCWFNNNTATNGINWLGGGLYATLGSMVRLEDCMIMSNSVAWGIGGGVSAVASGTSLTMIGCMLAHGVAGWGGGWNISNGATGVLMDCVIHDNVASSIAGGEGGGGGIGSQSSTVLSHCTITHNSANGNFPGRSGGGLVVADTTDPVTSARATLNNCIIYSNVSPFGADVHCGTDLLTNTVVHVNYSDIGDVSGEFKTSVGRINADPLFMDPEVGDFHLKVGSPCIDAGLLMEGMGPDMDGESRPFGPTVDIGADEYTDTDIDELPDYWENAYSLSATNASGNSGRDGDSDNDGLKNWAEFMAGTDPTNSGSVFKLTAGDFPDTNSIVLTWTSASGRRYNIYRTTNLMNSFGALASNLPATPAINVYTDTVTGIGPWFYRVNVEP